MQTTVSTDGTNIGYETTGNGDPLVLVHGGSTTKESWRDLVPHLADDYEVVTYDRRGRGDSGDADEYSLDREVADLRAVVDAVDGGPAVFGHSFGGLVALAAAGDVPMDRLVLYEPALLVGAHRGDDLAARMQSLVDDGDRLAAVELFFETVGAAEHVPDPAVRQAAGIVETVVRENREIEAYELGDPDLSAPALLVAGDRGPTHLRDAVAELDRRADAERIELAGVGHLGVHSAPERLAAVVRGFAD